MATRLDYKVSVTPIQEVGDDTEGGGVKTDVIAFDWQKSLGGGNSALTWAGNNAGEWTDGTNTIVTAAAATITTPASCNGLWVKNSGVTFADQTIQASSTSTVTLTIGTKVVATLGNGEGMFFPSPAQETDFITLAVGTGDTVAVEYAIFK